MTGHNSLPLQGYRALDLTDERGQLCGKILADMGADVIKVEPPGGDPSRNTGPFWHGVTDAEKCLPWFAYNTNKRGVTLNIETEDGAALFLRLVRAADFVIESSDAGYLAGHRLGYGDLCRVRPEIIMVSITGFGQAGPYGTFKAPDIVCMAMGGAMNLTGDPGRPPLRIGVPQAYLHAGAEAAVGALMALWHRELTGEGQHVDVSAQECITWTGLANQAFWDIARLNLTRQGPRRPIGRSIFRCLFQCKDGYVVFIMIGGPAMAQSLENLVKWMDSEGMADEVIRRFDWGSFDVGSFTTEQATELEPRFARFFRNKTKSELFDFALRNHLLLAPVNSARDLVEDQHLRERKFWTTFDHPELGLSILYPGSPYLSTEDQWRAWRRAPLIGEDNESIYAGELGMTGAEISRLRANGVI